MPSRVFLCHLIIVLPSSACHSGTHVIRTLSNSIYDLHRDVSSLTLRFFLMSCEAKRMHNRNSTLNRVCFVNKIVLCFINKIKELNRRSLWCFLQIIPDIRYKRISYNRSFEKVLLYCFIRCFRKNVCGFSVLAHSLYKSKL